MFPAKYFFKTPRGTANLLKEVMNFEEELRRRFVGTKKKKSCTSR